MAVAKDILSVQWVPGELAWTDESGEEFRYGGPNRKWESCEQDFYIFDHDRWPNAGWQVTEGVYPYLIRFVAEVTFHGSLYLVSAGLFQKDWISVYKLGIVNDFMATGSNKGRLLEFEMKVEGLEDKGKDTEPRRTTENRTDLVFVMVASDNSDAAYPQGYPLIAEAYVDGSGWIGHKDSGYENHPEITILRFNLGFQLTVGSNSITFRTNPETFELTTEPSEDHGYYNPDAETRLEWGRRTSGV